jgi:hypothetical protein
MVFQLTLGGGATVTATIVLFLFVSGLRGYPRGR